MQQIFCNTHGVNVDVSEFHSGFKCLLCICSWLLLKQTIKLAYYDYIYGTAQRQRRTCPYLTRVSSV